MTSFIVIIKFYILVIACSTVLYNGWQKRLAYTTIATNTWIMGCVQSDEALSWAIERRQLVPIPGVHKPRLCLWLTELSGSPTRPLCSKALSNDSTSSQWLQVRGSTNRNLSITEGWMHHPFPAQRDLTVSPHVRPQWKPTPLCFRSFLPQNQGDTIQRQTLVHFIFIALHTWPHTPLYKANRSLTY